MDNANDYNEEIRNALTLTYRMGLIPVESPLWSAVVWGHPNFDRWALHWDSGELREALEVLQEVDEAEFERVAEELASIDVEGADIYSGKWFRGEVVMYTEKGVEEYLSDYHYYEAHDVPRTLHYYIDFELMARDSILSGDWEYLSSMTQSYYVAN